MKRITYVNPHDSDWTKNQYVLCFGAYGATYLLVNANSLDSALDEAIDWLVEHEHGIIGPPFLELAHRLRAARHMERAHDE